MPNPLSEVDRLFNPAFEIRDAARIARTLQEIRDERVHLTVMLSPQLDETYGTVILVVDIKQRLFTLDELLPRDGNDMLRSTKKFRILGRSGGLVTAFHANLAKVVADPHGDIYQIAFPRVIYQMQRREHYRVPADQQQLVLVRLKKKWAEPVVGELFDVSVGGLGLVLPAEATRLLQPGDRLDCHFALPEEEPVDVQIEIRAMASRPNAYGKRLIRGGVQFLLLKPTDLHAIQRYVSKRDREILRHKRMDE